MKKNISVIVIAILIVCSGFVKSQQTEKKSEGIWQGKLNTGAVTLRVVFRLYQNSDGVFSGFLDSPDQGAKDIPIENIQLSEDSIRFIVPKIMGSYTGEKISGTQNIKGTWTQGGMKLPLDFNKVDKVEEVKRPQTPKPPFPYSVEYIKFENKSAGIQLAGTVTSPLEKKKYPAVVLVTGSGPQDRDETIFGHKPFWVIADYLTRKGIVVLRFDDRGIGESQGNFQSATSIDFASDAISAVEYLKSREDVNKKEIGIIGHSEGGLIAPMAAESCNDVGFIVLLAGPGVRGSELLKTQASDIMRVNGSPDSVIEKTLKNVSETYDIILSTPDSLTAYNKLEKTYNKDIEQMSDEEKKNPENSREGFESSMKTLLSPWFRFFIKYDPKPALENLTIPVLALNGTNDLQVSAKENLKGIEEALKTGGNKNYKIVELPGLNHLFQHSKTGAISEYAQIEETFSTDALKIISDWINQITRQN